MHFLPKALKLDSHISRKLLLSFIITIVLPVTLIAYLSLGKMSSQLVQQSFDHSRQVSKTVGMVLFRQLELATREMERYLSRHTPDQIGIEGHETARTPEDNRISNYHFISTDSTNNKNISKLSITDAAWAHIRSGRIAIVLDVSADSKKADILLIRKVRNSTVNDVLIVGRLNKDYLVSMSSILDADSRLVLTGPDGELLLGSTQLDKIMHNQLARMLRESISGHFKWGAGESRHLTSYWSLFTKEAYSLPFITISVTRPEATILSTVTNFREVYIPVLLLAMVAVTLLSVYRLRRLLQPIKILADATRNISRGHFRNQIDIEGNDELSELGRAFNTMSWKLERQFRSLSVIADLDTLILSSFNIDNIVSSVLASAPTLTPCSSAAILMLDEGSSSGELYARQDISRESVITMDINLTDSDLEILSDTDYLIADQGNTDLQLIDSLQRFGSNNFLLFPLYLNETLAAVIMLGYDAETNVSDEELTYLKKFSDHVTVALNNSRWEERMYHQAHHDELTSLPNRAMLKDRLDQALKRAERNNYSMAVLFVDIDRFKLINDTLGHTAGDKLLVKISEILTGSVRNTDTVVRFGGDEFVIIIPDIENTDDSWTSLAMFADKIIEKVSGQLSIGNHVIRSGISIGISIYPRDGLITDELIKNADAAMYYAKQDGRARFKFYSSDINDEISRRVQIEQDLYRALEDDQFFLEYQPKIDCMSGQLCGAEALIRWAHPEKGTIYPDDFIYVAEETTIINSIGEWVIETICRQLANWSQSGLDVIPIAVNIAPRHFKERDLDTYIQDTLSSTNISPDLLELEVTEGAVMENTDVSIRKLIRLRDMGIKLSIDDFGTGFSSLSYLRSLPIDKLKIDRSFIKGMTEDKNTWAIVSSIIYLAHQLGLEVIAEGVETKVDLEILRQLSCDECQGFLIGKAVKAKEFRSNLSATRPIQQARGS